MKHKMSNDIIAASNNALSSFGKLSPGNLAFEDMRKTGLIQEDGTAHDIDILLNALWFEIDERVKSGMSADVTIETDKRENVLSVPYRAIVYKDSKRFVRILQGKEMQEIEVEIGLKGSEGEIEIISGLNEGDKVITFIKK